MINLLALSGVVISMTADPSWTHEPDVDLSSVYRESVESCRGGVWLAGEDQDSNGFLTHLDRDGEAQAVVQVGSEGDHRVQLTALARAPRCGVFAIENVFGPNPDPNVGGTRITEHRIIEVDRRGRRTVHAVIDHTTGDYAAGLKRLARDRFVVLLPSRMRLDVITVVSGEVVDIREERTNDGFPSLHYAVADNEYPILAGHQRIRNGRTFVGIESFNADFSENSEVLTFQMDRVRRPDPLPENRVYTWELDRGTRLRDMSAQRGANIWMVGDAGHRFEDPFAWIGRFEAETAALGARRLAGGGLYATVVEALDDNGAVVLVSYADNAQPDSLWRVNEGMEPVAMYQIAHEPGVRILDMQRTIDERGILLIGSQLKTDAGDLMNPGAGSIAHVRRVDFQQFVPWVEPVLPDLSDEGEAP